MPKQGDWLSSREAARRLDVKLATLYAYASRGLVESVPSADGRGRRYARASIERLKARHDARAGHAAVASSALRWGEPSLDTSISEIRVDGPYYRGQSALQLSERGASFESVAELLWTGQLGPARWEGAALPLRSRGPGSPSARLASAVAQAALRDDARHGASDAEEQQRARRLVLGLASAAGGAGQRLPVGVAVAERLLRSFGTAPSSKLVTLTDRALVLCADHELNASTFATRVAASTGADLYACLATGLHTLSGPRHGGVAARIEALLAEIGRPANALRVVRARLERGEEIPGFGHTLYAAGDPRYGALVALAGDVPGARTSLALCGALCRAMEHSEQPLPNFDMGLMVLTRAARLPASAASAIFAVGRSAGWIAHALEQRAQGFLLRPRARYVPSPT